MINQFHIYLFLTFFLSCGMSFSSMAMIQSCADSAKNAPSWIKNKYCSVISNVEDTLHLPTNSLKIGLPVAAAFVSLFAMSSSDTIDTYIEKSKIAGKVAGGCGLFYGALWTKRWWDFSSLEKKLRLASSPATASYGNFRFSAWKQRGAWKQWRRPEDILDNKNDIQKQLKQDAGSFDQLYLDGKAVLLPVSDHDIKRGMSNELKRVQEDLNYVGSFTPAPEVIADCLTSEKFETSVQNSSFINIDNNIHNLMSDSKLVDTIINVVIEKAKPSWIKRFIYFPGYQFWKFRFAPKSEQATQLYCAIFRHYVRLSALKFVADKMKRWEIHRHEAPSENVTITVKQK